MAHLGAPLILSAQDTVTSTSTQAHPLGAYAETSDGRGFRYAKVGSSALVAGDVIQAPAQITTHQQLTPTAAAAIGDTSITVTLGATAATANQYADGWAVIDTAPGAGHAYQIESHPAADASATLTVTLRKSDAIAVALTTTSRVSLQANPYSAVIQAPVTTLTGAPVGVAPAAHTAAYYGWIQTHGPAATQIDGTPGVGLAVGPPSTAAGAAAINSSTNPIIGNVMVTGVDGKFQAVFLTID